MRIREFRPSYKPNYKQLTTWRQFVVLDINKISGVQWKKTQGFFTLYPSKIICDGVEYSFSEDENREVTKWLKEQNLPVVEEKR